MMGRRALRTQGLILSVAREIFLQRGYGGTRIDDIARTAGISRASFYTYFPSKRDVLLTIGTNSYLSAEDVVGKLREIPAAWTREHLEDWVSSYLEFLDEHGAFILVWGQATWGDEELRQVGVRAQLRVGRHLGEQLERLRGKDGLDPTREGLAVLAMLDRFWYFWRVAKAPFTHDEIVSTLGFILAALVRGAP